MHAKTSSLLALFAAVAWANPLPDLATDGESSSLGRRDAGKLLVCQPDESKGGKTDKSSPGKVWTPTSEWELQATNFCNDACDILVTEGQEIAFADYPISMTNQNAPKNGNEAYGDAGTIAFWAVNNKAGPSASFDFFSCYYALRSVSTTYSPCFGPGHHDVKGGSWKTDGDRWIFGGAIHPGLGKEV